VVAKGAGVSVEFEDYVRLHAARLLRLATVMCPDRHAAEDVVQEVLIRAHQRWPVIGAVPHPHAYVRRMVVNEAVSWRRKWTRIEPHPAGTLDRSTPDSSTAIDDRAEIVSAVLALPPKQRAAVVLRYFEGLTDAEIADALGCRPGTVRGYIHRALRVMRVDLTAPATPAFPMIVNEGNVR
jgi:RNA polymerase sigma-70 factor (sigma-E family)